MKQALVGFLLGLLPATGFGQSQEADSRLADAYYHFARAQALELDGDWDGALEAYEDALDLDPLNSSIYSEIAASYLRQGEYLEAVDYADRAVAIDNDNFDAHQTLSLIFVALLRQTRQGQQISPETVERAIQELEHVVRLRPSERDAYLTLGSLYRARGEPERAAAVYEDFLAVEPGSEDGAIALAELQRDAGNTDEAVEILTKFLEGQPYSARSLVLLGEVYLLAGDFPSAADALERAVVLVPDDTTILSSLAEALFLAGRSDDAARWYERLLEEDPGDPIAHLRMGQIERDRMNFDEAREHLSRAIELVPESPEIQFNMALLDRDEGRFAEAASRLRSLLDESARPNGRYTRSESGNRLTFLRHLALIYSFDEKYDETILALEEMITLTPDGDGTLEAYIVDTYRVSGETDRAFREVNQALNRYPANRQLLLQRADMIAEQGEVAEGIGLLRELIRTEPDDFEAYSTIVGIHEREGDFPAAQQVLDEILERFSEDDRAYFLQGALYEKQQNYDEAKAAFRRALEIDAQNPATLNYLGYLLADRNEELEEALEMIRAAVAADPINGAYLDSLGWVYYRLDELELAEVFLERAILFAGRDPTLHEHLGDLYYRTGRIEEAEAAYERSLELAEEEEEREQVRTKLEAIRSPTI